MNLGVEEGPGAPGGFTWITYLQLWQVGIDVVDKVQLCHKVLGHTPTSVYAHGQGVHDVSINSTEGGWEVSASIKTN